MLIDQNLIVCDCGVQMTKLSRFAVSNGYMGYEGMINLPGTVGGAIVNNSGCYGCGIDTVLKSIELLTPEGTIINLKVKDLDYQFRTSNIKKGIIRGIILRAYLDISQRDSPEVLIDIANKNSQNRLITQDPPAHNLGTTVHCISYNKNLKNAIFRAILKVVRILVKDPIKIHRLSKSLILILYRKSYLSEYISDKRMNCYIWKDTEADKYFEDYLDLMRKVYQHTSIEIEIYT